VTVATLDSASVALVKGDVVLLVSDAQGNNVVTKAVGPALLPSSYGWGILKDDTLLPGKRGHFWDEADGMIPPSFTGLAPGVSGPVRISAAGRCELVTGYTAGDNPVGSADTRGYMRFAPQMAEPIEKLLGQGPPSVLGFYGDDSTIRETSGNSTVDVGVGLLVAAVAIPNLLRSRIAANEASAVGSVRSVNTAQVVYLSTYPKRGYAPNLASLGGDPRGNYPPSPEHADLLDSNLANESCTGDVWCTKSGFHFRVTSLCNQHLCTEYVAVATPIESNTGTRSFCSTSDGVIRFKIADPLTSPLSVPQCRMWEPIR